MELYNQIKISNKMTIIQCKANATMASYSSYSMWQYSAMAERRVSYFVLAHGHKIYKSEPGYSYCLNYAFLQSASESVEYDRKFVLTGKYILVHNYCKFFIDLIYLFISSLVHFFFKHYHPVFNVFASFSSSYLHSHFRLNR